MHVWYENKMPCHSNTSHWQGLCTLTTLTISCTVTEQSELNYSHYSQHSPLVTRMAWSEPELHWDVWRSQSVGEERENIRVMVFRYTACHGKYYNQAVKLPIKQKGVRFCTHTNVCSVHLDSGLCISSLNWDRLRTNLLPLLSCLH